MAAWEIKKESEAFKAHIFVVLKAKNSPRDKNKQWSMQHALQWIALTYNHNIQLFGFTDRTYDECGQIR